MMLAKLPCWNRFVRSIFLLPVLIVLPAWGSEVETVYFKSEDGKTDLVAYLFLPQKQAENAKTPAIVLLHGRSGVYSSTASEFNAKHLSSRTKLWGKFWAERGYLSLYIDSFGPRAYPKGFEAGTNDGNRPAEISELVVRPSDVKMGLRYLLERSDVDKEQIFLQGWSNGGTTTLVSMMDRRNDDRAGVHGFKAAIAVYPACTQVSRQFEKHYQSYAPVLLFIGTEDEEVSYRNCQQLVETSRRGDVELVSYDGATHSYDTPIPKRTTIDANLLATKDTFLRAEAFFQQFR